MEISEIFEISEILYDIFNIKKCNTSNNIDLYILHKLKKHGYIYLINSWKKLEQIKDKINDTTYKNVLVYFNTYLKIFLIENDLNKGIYEYIESICNINNKENQNISLHFFDQFINKLDDTDLEIFVLNIIRIINIININKYTLLNLIEFYNIIIKEEKICNIITNSDKWICDTTLTNEHSSYIGKLITKTYYSKIDWNKNIILLSKCFSDLFNSYLNIPIYKWFIKGIELNKSKLNIMNQDNIVYSNKLLINIIIILKDEFDLKIILNNNYSEIDNKYYNLDIEDICDYNSVTYFLLYWYFIIGFKYIIKDYIDYCNELKNVETKLNDILGSSWWNNNSVIRIQYLSKLKKKKICYKRKKKNYENIIYLDNILPIYFEICNYIAKSLLLNKNLYENNDIHNQLLDSLIQSNTFIKTINIEPCMELIIYNLLNNPNLSIKYKCIEFYVNYIPTNGINHLNNQLFNDSIITIIINLFIEIKELKDDQFYDKYEPRYYLLFLLKFLLNYESYTNKFFDYIKNNNDNMHEFILILLNDLSDLFYEIIYNFDKINDLHTRLKIQSTLKLEDNYIKISNLLETFCTFFIEYIVLLHILIEKIYNDISFTKKIYEKLEEVLTFIIRKFCITNYDSIIKINNINLDTEIIIIKLMNILINVYTFEEGKNIILKNASNYKKNLFELLRVTFFTDKISNWYILYNIVIFEHDLNIYITNNKSDIIIPDKYLDPLLNTLMTNPVFLPKTDTIIDLETIKKHLENNEFNPFNREKLTLNEVIHYNNNKDKKKKLEIFKKEIMKYL